MQRRIRASEQVLSSRIMAYVYVVRRPRQASWSCHSMQLTVLKLFAVSRSAAIGEAGKLMQVAELWSAGALRAELF